MTNHKITESKAFQALITESCYYDLNRCCIIVLFGVRFCCSPFGFDCVMTVAMTYVLVREQHTFLSVGNFMEVA